LRSQVIDDPAGLARWSPAWDHLARGARRPYCAPAWMLAWWMHVAPRRSALRVILVHRGEELLGVAPFFVDRGYGGLARYRFLAAGTSMRVEPVACPGTEGAVASAFAQALSAHRPAPDVIMFEGVDSTSPWPALCAAALHGTEGPWVHRDVERPAPTL